VYETNAPYGTAGPHAMTAVTTKVRWPWVGLTCLVYSQGFSPRTLTNIAITA
jgi:hypothetical protein